jgi:hypothetical protein
MTIRLLFTLVGLPIGFALPTLAQQKSTPDPQLREQILALDDTYDNGRWRRPSRALHGGLR